MTWHSPLGLWIATSVLSLGLLAGWAGMTCARHGDFAQPMLEEIQRTANGIATAQPANIAGILEIAAARLESEMHQRRMLILFFYALLGLAAINLVMLIAMVLQKMQPPNHQTQTATAST